MSPGEPSLPVRCRTTRKRIMLSDDYLRRTAEVFEAELGRPVSRDEAREIAENVLRYLEALSDGAAPQ